MAVTSTLPLPTPSPSEMGRSLEPVKIRGKFYNLQICLFDALGKEIPVDISIDVLHRIHQIAAQQIFGAHPSDPDQMQFRRESNPEACFAYNTASKIREDLLMTQVLPAPQIVAGLRQIHQLLQSPLGGMPSQQSSLSAPISPRPIFSFPSGGVPPSGAAATSLTRPPMPNQTLTAWMDLVKPEGAFFKEVTYSALFSYAREGGKKPQGSSLQCAYSAFQEFLRSCEKTQSATESQEQRAMHQWIKRLYRAAYDYYEQSYRNQYKGSENFDVWCRESAAYAVVGFILTPQPIEPALEALQKIIIDQVD